MASASGDGKGVFQIRMRRSSIRSGLSRSAALCVLWLVWRVLLRLALGCTETRLFTNDASASAANTLTGTTRRLMWATAGFGGACVGCAVLAPPGSGSAVCEQAQALPGAMFMWGKRFTGNDIVGYSD